jgi:hypothetical protein
MNQANIAGWFGLKRPNFILDPRTDAAFYASRTGVSIPIIVENLQIDLVAGLPPKRLFWGVYGGGKTHTLFYVASQLEKLTPIYPIYVECPNIARRSTFLHLYHDGIMASMGQDFLLSLLEELIDTIGIVRRDQLLVRLRERVGREDIARAIASLLGAESGKKLALWRFISGVAVPRADLEGLEQTEDLTEAEPAKLAEVMVIIGKILKDVRRQTLVFILDELDRLESVGEETGTTFRDAFRKLVDPNQSDVAVLMACSAANLTELQEVFGGENSPVLSRIGRNGIIEVPSLNPEEVDPFIRQVILYLRDDSFDIDTRIKEVQAEGLSETLEPDFFPFSRECLEALKGVLSGVMTPREITQRMTHALGKAYLMNRRVVTADIIG